MGEKGSKGSKSTSIVLSSSASSSSAAAAAPWLDLPDGVTDVILERLNLRDYMRFAVVCRKWRSIQKDHRLRHSPGAPPMRQALPWMLPSISFDINPISCLSLSDCALNRFTLPLTSDYVFSPSRGWLFVFTDVPVNYSKQPAYLLNPISGGRLQLPSLSPHIVRPCVGVLSSPPADPDCMALIIDNTMISNPISLCRVHDRGEWFKIPVKENTFIFGSSISAVFSGGKFYCFYNGLFRVIDPLFPSPSMRTLEMDCARHLSGSISEYLVESYGEVLMVVAYCTESYDGIKDFRVFKADFSRMMWVMLEALGDRVLFIDRHSGYCLSTAEVGCKKNLIYYTTGSCGDGHDDSEPTPPAWRVFDLDARRWIDGLSFPDELGFPLFTRWFVPTLESAANPL